MKRKKAGGRTLADLPESLMAATLHMPTSDPEKCIAIEFHVLDTKKHHFDRKGKSKDFAYNDADSLWFTFLRLLPKNTLEDLLLVLAMVDFLKNSPEPKKGSKTDPAKQAKAEIQAALNPGKPSRPAGGG